MLWILKDAFRFYRAYFYLICLIFIPVFLLELIVTHCLEFFMINKNSSLIIKSLPTVFGMFTSAIYTAGLIFLFDSITNGSVLSHKECIKKAIISFPLFFITVFLVRLMIAGGLLLLIVPGMILAARLCLSQFYVLLSDKTPIVAIKHSFQKTKGFTIGIINSAILAYIPMFLVIIVSIIILSSLNLLHMAYAVFFGSFIFEIFNEFYFIFILIVLFRIFYLLNQNNAKPE